MVGINDTVLLDSVSDVSGEFSTSKNWESLLAGSELLVKLSNGVVIDVSKVLIAGVFSLNVRLESSLVTGSSGNEVLSLKDLVDGSFQISSLVLDINGELSDFNFLLVD